MIGPQGVPAIVTKMALMEFFHCDWLTLHDIPYDDWQEALMVLSVQGEIRAKTASDKSPKESGVMPDARRRRVVHGEG